MVTADFSWFNILSVFGTGILCFLCFIITAGGIFLITDGHSFNGVAVIIGGIICGVLAWLVYRNYQKKTRAAAPGVKIEDIKKPSKK